MLRTGQARKRDANEAQIVLALRKAGCYVVRASEAGGPDLFVYAPQTKHWHALEVKSARGRVTPLQQSSWVAVPVPIVHSVDEALEAVGLRLSGG